MSICPWCKGSTPRAHDICPLCGKSPHEHPSIAGSGFASFEGFDDFEEPGDLDVGGTTEPLGSSDGPDVFGGEAFQAAPSKLVLEVDAPIRQSGRFPARTSQPSFPSQPAQPSQPDLRPSMPAANSYRGGGEQEPEPANRYDPYEIALLADYGPAPTKIWEFPSYAVRVTTRKRDLGRRLALAKQSALNMEHQRDDRLADLAEKIRPQLEASRELAQLLEPLQQVEQTAATRMEALSARNQELEQKVSVVDQEIEAQQGTETSAKGQQDAAAKKLDHARGELERARASLKRAEIELRNVQDVARAAAGPQARTALPEHAEKIQSLTAILQERREAMAAPQAAFDQAQRVWNDADTALKTVQRRISDLQKQRRTIEQSYAKELGVRSQGVEQVQSERRAALVTIGARLMEMQAPIVPEPLRQAFFQAQELLAASIREVERLEQAVGTADPSAVNKGWMVIGGAAVLLLLLLVVLIALLGRSEPDPLYGMIGAYPSVFALADHGSCSQPCTFD